MKVAIRIIYPTAGHGDGYRACGQVVHEFPSYPGSPETVIDGPIEARRKGRELIRAGADVLKVAVSGGFVDARPSAMRLALHEDELTELVSVARSAGIPVMAHAHSAESVALAARCGVTSVEHGTFIDKVAAAEMCDNNVYLVPTLLASATLRDRNPKDFASIFERHVESVGHCIDAGVKIACGTDSGIVPHGRILGEVDLLISAGLTPFAAVEAASISGARLIGEADSYGTIDIGKAADFVIISGSLSPGMEQRLRQVWQAGRLVESGRDY